jgi:hypothetical protein
MVKTRKSRDAAIIGASLRPTPALEEDYHGGQPTGKNQGRASVIQDQLGPTMPIWVNTGVAANHHA